MSVLIRYRRLLLTVSLLLMVVGTKLVVVNRSGSDLPEWDQWDAEGLQVLLPWQQGSLGLADLFRAHNEHRIVLTKVLGLAQAAVVGQWDARVQCIVNAFIHASLAAGLFWWGGQSLVPWARAAWFSVLLVLFAPPIAWQNVIAGFHSQQYFLLGFSVAAIWLLPFHQPYSGRWWTGIIALALAFFSMGSGFLAAATIVAVSCLQFLCRNKTLPAIAPTALVGLAVTAIGWFTRTTVDHHDSLRAQSLGEFFTYLMNSLRWPAGGSGAIAVLIWAPWLIVVIRFLLRAKGSAEALPTRAAALGGWTLLQILASAYARGAGGGEPASRYMDTLGLGLTFNALAAILLCSDRSAQRPVRWMYCALALAWTGVVGSGLNKLVRENVVNELEGWVVAYHREGEERTRAYLATGERVHLESDQIPYPGAGAFIERLNHPELRALLPASVRPPISLSQASGGGFAATDFGYPRPAGQPTGLSPETPERPHGVVFGSFGTEGNGRWESQPLSRPSHHWLRFEVAGNPDSSAVTLRLVDPESKAVLRTVVPASGPAGAWRPAYVEAPDRPFVVVAEDSATDRWLAFTEPVEMARISRWGEIVASRGPVFAVAGSGLAFLAILGSLTALRRERAGPTP